MTQEHERWRVRPVRVLEHEQQRLPASCAGENVRHHRVQAMTLGVGVGGDRRRQPGHASGQVGNDSAQLAARTAEVLAQHLGIGAPRELIERVGEGAVGGSHHRVARPVEHEHPFRGDLVRQLADQAALARSGLAAHQRQPTPLAGLARHKPPQRHELSRPTDERRRRGETERAGKRVHTVDRGGTSS